VVQGRTTSEPTGVRLGRALGRGTITGGLESDRAPHIRGAGLSSEECGQNDRYHDPALDAQAENANQNHVQTMLTARLRTRPIVSDLHRPSEHDIRAGRDAAIGATGVVERFKITTFRGSRARASPPGAACPAVTAVLRWVLSTPVAAPSRPLYRSHAESARAEPATLRPARSR
jgi:hypothetical protein